MALAKEELTAKRDEIIKGKGEEYYKKWLEENSPDGGYENLVKEGSSRGKEGSENEEEKEGKSINAEEKGKDENSENSGNKTVENDKGNERGDNEDEDIVCPMCKGNLHDVDNGLLYCPKCEEYYAIETTETDQ